MFTMAIRVYTDCRICFRKEKSSHRQQQRNFVVNSVLILPQALISSCCSSLNNKPLGSLLTVRHEQITFIDSKFSPSFFASSLVMFAKRIPNSVLACLGFRNISDVRATLLPVLLLEDSILFSSAKAHNYVYA